MSETTDTLYPAIEQAIDRALELHQSTTRQARQDGWRVGGAAP